MHLADAFIHIYSGYKKCYQYVCCLGIEPTSFRAANAMLYHWEQEQNTGLWDKFENSCSKLSHFGLQKSVISPAKISIK